MQATQMKVTSVLDHQPLENRRTCYLLDIQQPFNLKGLQNGGEGYDNVQIHQRQKKPSNPAQDH